MQRGWESRRARPALLAIITVLFMGGAGHAAAPAGRMARGSPAHLFGLVNRQRPWPYTDPWFTPAELDVLARRFELLSGLDGHGYDFPGALGDVLALNPGVAALTHWESMGVAGQRIGTLDHDEDAFLHSADPASLTASVFGGATVLWFLQDGRARAYSSYYEPPGVLEYVVEVAEHAGAPFLQFGPAIPDEGLGYYTASDPVVSAARVYRVRSRLASTGQLVPYSWTVSADPAAPVSLAVGRVLEDGSMCALCYGDCPASADGLRAELDLDNDHEFETDEQFVFASRVVREDGSVLYEGVADGPGVAGRYSQRIAVAATPERRVPLAGAYQSGMYNNRIQMRLFGTYLVWPDHPSWIALTSARLAEALAAGYVGMRLDFVLDTLAPSWSASGLLADWEPGDPRIADAMNELLAALRSSQPAALFAINGYFAIDEPEHFYEYLDRADAADFEFFALSAQSESPVVEYSTTEAVEQIWQTRAAGRLAIALCGAAPENVVGRLNSFAMYLLALDEGVLFYNESDAACQAVTWLAEWEVPLGAPLQAVDSWEDLLDPRGAFLLSRAFQFGSVLYNRDDAPVVVALDAPMYRLDVVGGQSPRVGGDGAAGYTPVTQVTLAPQHAAILLATVPGDVTGDGVFDAADWAALPACLAGPGLPVACPAADMDGDADVDFHDLADLQLWAGGPP